MHFVKFETFLILIFQTIYIYNFHFVLFITLNWNNMFLIGNFRMACQYTKGSEATFSCTPDWSIFEI